MSHIFVSYSRHDLEKVDQLVAHLCQTRVPVWIDRLGIRGGDQWRRQIVEAIQDCEAFLLVLSRNSASSKNIRKEVDLAEHYHKRIIPVTMEEVEIPDELEYQLVGIQRLDLTHPMKEKYPRLDAILHEFRETGPVIVQGVDVEDVEAYKTERSTVRTTEEGNLTFDESARLSKIFRLEAEIEAAIKEEDWEDAQKSLDELPRLGSEGQTAAKRLWSQLAQAQRVARRRVETSRPQEATSPKSKTASVPDRASTWQEVAQAPKPQSVSGKSRSRTWLYGGGILLVLLIGIAAAGWYRNRGEEPFAPPPETEPPQGVEIGEEPITLPPETEPPQSVETGSVIEGVYRIMACSGRFWHAESTDPNDQLISTLKSQPEDDLTRFYFEPQDDGSYRIRVIANDLYLHVDGRGDKLFRGTHEDDEFTLFYFELQEEGNYKIKNKGDDRYVHEDGLPAGTKLLSTLDQPEDCFIRFLLIREGS